MCCACVVAWSLCYLFVRHLSPCVCGVSDLLKCSDCPTMCTTDIRPNPPHVFSDHTAERPARLGRYRRVGGVLFVLYTEVCSYGCAKPVCFVAFTLVWMITVISLVRMWLMEITRVYDPAFCSQQHSTSSSQLDWSSVSQLLCLAPDPNTFAGKKKKKKAKRRVHVWLCCSACS